MGHGHLNVPIRDGDLDRGGLGEQRDGRGGGLELGGSGGGGGGDALDAVDTDLVAEGGPGDGGGDAETVGGAGVTGGCGSGR